MKSFISGSAFLICFVSITNAFAGDNLSVDNFRFPGEEAFAEESHNVQNLHGMDIEEFHRLQVSTIQEIMEHRWEMNWPSKYQIPENLRHDPAGKIESYANIYRKIFLNENVQVNERILGINEISKDIHSREAAFVALGGLVSRFIDAFDIFEIHKAGFQQLAKNSPSWKALRELTAELGVKYALGPRHFTRRAAQLLRTKLQNDGGEVTGRMFEEVINLQKLFLHRIGDGAKGNAYAFLFNMTVESGIAESYVTPEDGLAALKILKEFMRSVPEEFNKYLLRLKDMNMTPEFREAYSRSEFAKVLPFSCVGKI